MNAVRGLLVGRFRDGLWVLLLTALVASMAGCHRKLPTPEELVVFDSMGDTIVSGFELNEFLRAQVPVGPYHVVPGDLLHIDMPDVLGALGYGSEVGNQPGIRRRIRSDGTLRLPGLEADLPVEQMTVGQIEEAIESTYEKEILSRPAVVVNVLDFDTIYVSVCGLGIRQPGLYRLRSDERSLSALLMRAGGIVPTGASVIRVTPPGVGDDSKTLELPVRDVRVPMEDVLLAGGESVEVVRLAPSFMTILGQVGRPGRYPLDRANPPTLIEAISNAGSVREVEDPRYISIFRKDNDGQYKSARFCLAKRTALNGASLFHENDLGDGAFATVKPGDILVVERTLRSRARQFIARAFHVSVGVSAAATGTYHEDFQTLDDDDDDEQVINNNYGGGVWPQR